MIKTSMPRGVLGYLGWLKARGHASPIQETFLKIAERARAAASKRSPAERRNAIRVARNLLHAAKATLQRDGSDPPLETAPDDKT